MSDSMFFNWMNVLVENYCLPLQQLLWDKHLVPPKKQMFTVKENKKYSSSSSKVYNFMKEFINLRFQDNNFPKV